MVSRCKHLSKRRDCKQAKDADRLAPKGMEGVEELSALLS